MNQEGTYPPEQTAAQFMTARVPVVRPHATIAEIETLLLKEASEFESINYVYVTTDTKKLVGVLSLKELFRSPKTRAAETVMRRELVTVKPHTREERVAYLTIEHNLKEIPVVDGDNRLVGVVPPNAIFKILHQEHIDSLLKFAGVHRFRDPGETILTASSAALFRKRLPWLLAGLAASMLTAATVNLFRSTIEAHILLAAFIPAIAYIAAAAGIQSETIFIRSLALDRNLKFKRYVSREGVVGLGLASLLAFSVTLLSFLLWRDPFLSLVLGISFFAAIFISMALGVFLPWCFSRLRIDPALTAGPFDTALSDIASILVYFTVATLVLQLFPNAY